MEDLGEAQHILGIKIMQTGDKQLLLKKENYMCSILDN
jgi:hypothetical protein